MQVLQSGERLAQQSLSPPDEYQMFLPRSIKRPRREDAHHSGQRAKVGTEQPRCIKTEAPLPTFESSDPPLDDVLTAIELTCSPANISRHPALLRRAAEDDWLHISNLLPAAYTSRPPLSQSLIRAALSDVRSGKGTSIFDVSVDCYRIRFQDPRARQSIRELADARPRPASDRDNRSLFVEGFPRNVTSGEAAVRTLKRSLDDVQGVQKAIWSVEQYSLQPIKIGAPAQSFSGSGHFLLESKELCIKALEVMPWKRDAAPGSRTTAGPLRACSKSQWLAMQSSYQLLRDELAQKQRESEVALDLDIGKRPPGQGWAKVVKGSAGDDVLQIKDVGEMSAATELAPDSSTTTDYPLGLIVHVSRIEPPSDKSTLQSLFEKSFGVRLDYIDYVAGASDCHLRLKNSTAAAALLAHCDPAKVASEATSLRLKGRCEGLQFRRLAGEEEATYWSKLPAKVRRMYLKKPVVP